MLGGTNSLLMIAVAGLLTGVAVWGVLYGLVLLYGGEQGRIRARVRQYVANPVEHNVDTNEVRAQQRANLFAELDSRWEDRGLFKALQEDLEAADLHLTPTEFLLLQAGIGIGLGLILWALVPFIGILLFPVGLIAGIYGTRSYARFMAKRRVQKFEEQ